MSAPQKLVDQLRRHEGEVLHAYKDHLGYLTIGVGRLIDKDRGGGITAAESAMLLDNDLARFAAELDKNVPWWRTMDEPRQCVIWNMAFNLGVGSVSPPRGLLAFVNTLELIRTHRYAEAADAMLKSKWATQVGKRATELAQQMRSGAWQ